MSCSTLTRTAILPFTATLLALAACADATSTAPVAPGEARVASSAAAAGGVYTMTNGASANAVLAFRRAADGALTPLTAVPTGGRGTGGTVDPLASQYSVVLDDANAFLFVVDAGSDEVTALRVNADASVAVTSRASSGGRMPVSLAVRDGRAYVLNAGDNTVSGLRINPNGKLIPIPNSTQALAPGAAGSSTIHFSADGSRVIVTERLSSRIETLAVLPNGRLGAPSVTASNGPGPFGFDVTPAGVAVVTEVRMPPANGTVSSYRIEASGALQTISASVDGGGKATCWLILSADGRYAYVANSASDAIGSLTVSAAGAVALVNGAAATTAPGATPIDLDLTQGDGFLYALEAGAGTIGEWAVNGAALTAGATTPAGAPGSGLQGLAAY